MHPAIRVQNLGKSYRLGVTHAGSLRDLVNRSAARLFSRKQSSRHDRHPGDSARTDHDGLFWALRDVSFEIAPGEVVGVIGKNGAGKSTLLKVMSRITLPDEGRAEMRGRVASLLEVGTGFHPELTGRENIFLNGAILGMTKSEIRRRFDEIVAFSEIDRFIDTPAKRYSSGMYVRLAFAVAAHLDPEILIVDEVLAVGDLDFQVKCFKKIKAVATGGKTVLLVSHNIAAVQQLCKRAILLANGSVYATGCVENVLRHYVATSTLEGQIGGPQGSRPKWAAPWINSIRMTTSTGVLTSTFQLGDDLGIEFDFQQPECKAISRPVMGVVIKNATGAVVGAVNTRMSAQTTFRSSAQAGTFHCRLIAPPLLQGTYMADVWLGDGAENIDCIEDAIDFQILPSDVYGTGRVPFAEMGCIFLNALWEFNDNAAGSGTSL